MSSPDRSHAPDACSWCGSALPTRGRGRPRKYCSRSCRQRAYEQRHKIQGTSIPAEAVILAPKRANALRDALYQIRCAAEDVRTASQENASTAELATLCDELVELTRQAERWR